MTSARQPVGSGLAAYVLFSSDRTCCVCREAGKAVQIHHIDGNRDNNVAGNLVVLCLDCHNATLIEGGFGRRLDPDQIILYRDDWYRIVLQRRSMHDFRDQLASQDSNKMEAITSVIETYREDKKYELLASYYNSLGNYELRDKYIELAIERNPDDETICFFRALQGKPELIPPEVAERRLKSLTSRGDWEQRARLYADLGKPVEAVKDYLRGIAASLDGSRLFSAAYYLKELSASGLVQKLFASAYEEAKAEGDLWWMIRALQELDWKQELKSVVLKNAEEIERSRNPSLLLLLARSRGDNAQALELMKEIARGTYFVRATKRESES